MDHLFDVFLSHNSKDMEFVREIARLLRERGLRPWLDGESLVGGEKWQTGLAGGLDSSATCAVFIGEHNIGNCEAEEIDSAQNKAVCTENYRLIPVILPGLDDLFGSKLPLFLRNRKWVDYRSGAGDERVLHELVCAIKGLPSAPLPAEIKRNSQREKEIVYLQLLREEDGKDLAKYTPLAGKATPMIKPV